MSKSKKLTAEQLADKIIAEMQQAGLSTREMVYVLHCAKMKYKRMKEEQGKEASHA